MKHNLFKIAISTLLFFVFTSIMNDFVIAQSISNIKDLSSINVDALSDEQLIKLFNQGSSSGLSIEEQERIALSRGMPASEINKLKLRLQKMQQTNTANTQITSTEPTEVNAIEGQSTSPSIEVPKDVNSGGSIYGQSIFRDGTISVFDKSQDAKAPANYVIGIGDEFGISVFGYSYYNEILKVDNKGSINPTNVGPIYVKGLTFERAKSLIRSKMGQYYDLSNNKLEITLAYSRSITVNIVGEVSKPGSYKIPAINTAFNALIIAGGPTNIGTMRAIQIKRNGKVVSTLDVYKFLNNPTENQDVFLQDNDYLVVQPSKKIVKIVGEVKRPLMYELLGNENLNSLIEYAGGLTSKAYIERIQILRTTQLDRKIIEFNLDSLMKLKKDFPLQNGDRVEIKQVRNELNSFVQIEGAVNLPGVYNFVEGDRISDVIEKAGGMEYGALIEKAFLFRVKEDFKKDLIPLNLKEILSNKSSAQNIKVKERDIISISTYSKFNDSMHVEVIGSVRAAMKMDYSNGMTLGDALFKAGGFALGADNLRIEISRVLYFTDKYVEGQQSRIIIEKLEVPKNLILDSEKLNLKLFPFDQIFVRQIPEFNFQKNITINGEVVYPGKYSLKTKDEKISDIIKRSGGLNKFAFVEGASLYRPDLPGGYIVLNLKQALKNNNSIYNYVLKEGDVLNIPTVIDFIAIKGTSVEYLSLVNLPQVNAPFVKGKRANYYINEFGNGFSKNAWRKKTYVVENNAKVSKTKNFIIFKVYPKVNKGSAIYVVNKPVKEKKVKQNEKGFDWNQFVETTTSKIIAIATILVLFKQL